MCFNEADTTDFLSPGLRGFVHIFSDAPGRILASQVRAPWLARASGRGRTRGESRAAVQAVSCETRLHWGEWVIQPTVLEL
jgi:hypothetical protein